MIDTVLQEHEGLLQGLLDVGVHLSGEMDQQATYETILQKSRKLASAESGILYLADAESLKPVVVQNDQVDSAQATQALVGNELPLAGDSLIAFAVSTARTVNVRDTFNPPAGAAFRINRLLDAAAGYKVRSALAVPLVLHTGQCVGAMELHNHLDDQGQVGEFPAACEDGVSALAAMAAVTIHNAQLQKALKEAQFDCIIRLAGAAEFRDDDTVEHILRISKITALMAGALGLDASEVELIRYASPMHDIGKVGIPDAILRKPGPLTFEERNVVEKHTLIGAEILDNPPNELIHIARDIAKTHHERWDGKGYPNGLAGEDIPIYGRIVGLADVFDALVSKRCYKEAFALEIALEIMRFEDGKHFDPNVAGAFFGVLPEVLKSYGDLGQG